MIFSSLRPCLTILTPHRGPRLLRLGRAGGIQHRAVTGAAAAGITESHKKYKTYDDLPGPSMFTNLYWLFLRGKILYSHELQGIYKNMYGPMWRSTTGMYRAVNVADADLLEELLRQEGKYPVRSDMYHWKVHRNLRGLGLGPFTEEGHKWFTLRSVLNKRMLKPVEAALYVGIINEVVSDLLTMIEDQRKTSGVLVKDMANVLYRYSFEGVSYILFETRIGCLEKIIPAESKKFIDSIGNMLRYSVYIAILPSWTEKILPFYQRFIDNWDNIFAFGNKLIDQKMQKIQECVDRGEEVKGEYLTYLLSSGKLSNKEVSASVVELLLAGVDTTSNTLTWSLYHLARDHSIQNAFLQEINSVIPENEMPTAEHISKMPLLKAIVKETLRLYPVVPTNARIAVEKDMIIGDYWFPKDTFFTLAHYHVSREEKNFPEPNKFIPQRWLRENKVKNNPFSSIPFGYGIRACVGRRIAEMEMYLALIRIIRKYELRPDPVRPDVTAISRVVMAASRPINIQFIDRNAST